MINILKLMKLSMGHYMKKLNTQVVRKISHFFVLAIIILGTTTNAHANNNLQCTNLTINCTDNTDPAVLDTIYSNAIPTVVGNAVLSDLTYEDTILDFECSDPDYVRRISRQP